MSADLTKDYRIVDYYDGLFTIPTAVCRENTTSPSWTGVFVSHPYKVGSYYWWRWGWMLGDYWTISISGKGFAYSPYSAIELVNYAADKQWYWDLTVRCAYGTYTSADVWVGTKIFCGDSPAGVYTRIGGHSEEPTSLVVEQVP